MKSILSNATAALSQAGEHTIRNVELLKQESTSKILQAQEAASNAILQASEKTKELSGLTKKLEKVANDTRGTPAIISGLVWKRRGRLGSYYSFSNAWELRQMELKGSMLLYYENNDDNNSNNNHVSGGSGKVKENDERRGEEEASDINQDAEIAHHFSRRRRPRGYLDLKEEHNLTVQASFGHNSGAPSPFCISIKVGPVNETKWKLCFDEHLMQIRWLAAISDVVIQCSVDEYNQALIQEAAANINNNDINLREPPFSTSQQILRDDDRDDHHQSHLNKKTDNSNDIQRGKAHNRLWIMEDYVINNNHDTTSRENIVVKGSKYSDTVNSMSSSVESVSTNATISMEKEIALLQEQNSKLQHKIQQQHEQHKQQLKREEDNSYDSKTREKDESRRVVQSLSSENMSLKEKLNFLQLELKRKDDALINEEKKESAHKSINNDVIVELLTRVSTEKKTIESQLQILRKQLQEMEDEKLRIREKKAKESPLSSDELRFLLEDEKKRSKLLLQEEKEQTKQKLCKLRQDMEVECERQLEIQKEELERAQMELLSSTFQSLEENWNDIEKEYENRLLQQKNDMDTILRQELYRANTQYEASLTQITQKHEEELKAQRIELQGNKQQ